MRKSAQEVVKQARVWRKLSYVVGADIDIAPWPSNKCQCRFHLPMEELTTTMVPLLATPPPQRKEEDPSSLAYARVTATWMPFWQSLAPCVCKCAKCGRRRRGAHQLREEEKKQFVVRRGISIAVVTVNATEAHTAPSHTQRERVPPANLDIQVQVVAES